MSSIGYNENYVKSVFISFWPAIKNKSPIEAMKESSNNYVAKGLNNMNETALKSDHPY
jgi:hypothetical protein